MGDLSLLPLSQCARFVSGGTPSMQRAEYWGGNIPWVSAKDLKTLTLHDSQDHVTALGSANGTRMVNQGTILMLVRGMTLHHDVPICVAGRQLAFNQDIKALIPADGIHDRYLLYALLAHKPELLAMVDSAGHGTGRLNTDQLKALSIPMPPLPAQKRIAHILGTLDDKIELNRRMNATLEAMARAMFKSWFVDFDPVRAKIDGRKPEGLDPETAALFPSTFQESPMGPIPKGWSVGKVNDLAMLNRGAINPGDFPAETFDHFSLPAFDNGRTPKTELGGTIMSNKLTVTPNSVLLSKLNPHIPRIWLPDLNASRRSVCSTEFMVACSKPGVSREYLFSLFTGSAFASTYGTLVTGTTGSHQRIRPECVLDMKIVIPAGGLIQAFTKIAKPLLDCINRNIEQSRTLTTLRDTLLPKLLSGMPVEAGDRQHGGTKR